MRNLLFLTIFSLSGAVANAQMDPSSALLLNSGRTAPVRETGIDSGRYTVKPRSEAPRREERPIRRQSESTASASASASASATASSEAVVIEKPAQVIAPPMGETSNQAAASDENFMGPEVPSTFPISKPTVLVLPVGDFRRSTMLELSLAPGYFYNDSKSSFTNRNYTVNSPVFNVDGGVWFSENFGLRAGFIGTSNASVNDSLNHQQSVAISQQTFTAGARGRKYFGSGSLAPVLTFGVDYQESQFRVPSDSELRAKLTSTGAVFSLETEVPKSRLTSWTLGVAYAPFLRHRETSNKIEFKSGASPSASSVGITLGSRYRFDQSHSLFWKLSYSVEKNVFYGDSSIPDVQDGVTERGVNVTNSSALILLGYTWSD